MADADLIELEEIIRPCGLFRTKAQNLIDASRMIIERFGGEVPSGMDDLLLLPGVGRKIANLIRGDVFGLPAIVADTHCIRIAGKLGFYPETCKDPRKTPARPSATAARYRSIASITAGANERSRRIGLRRASSSGKCVTYRVNMHLVI